MTSDDVKTVLVKYQVLLEEYHKDSPDIKVCTNLLEDLKIDMTKINFLPNNKTAVTKQELLLVRDVLELGAKISLIKRNVNEFESYLNQLKTLYFDFDQYIPESVYMYELLGVNLVFLLSQGRLAEFHSELERINSSSLENKHIQFPIKLEQNLMGGSYNKLFFSRSNVPSDKYNFFLDSLFNTTRIEIAKCMEAAYLTIPANEAYKMLFFDTNAKEMSDFVAERGWITDGNGKNFIFKRSGNYRNPIGQDFDLVRRENNISDNNEEDTFIWNQVSAKLTHYAREFDEII